MLPPILEILEEFNQNVLWEMEILAAVDMNISFWSHYMKAVDQEHFDKYKAF